MKRTIQCNECSIKNCNIYKNKKFDCSIFLPDEGLQTPILMHLLRDNRKVQSAIDLLKKFKIEIREVTYYPYFKLVL